MTRAPYRTVDRERRRSIVVAEACRIRDALAASEPFFHIAGGQIAASHEIIDALTNCILELSS